MGPIEAQMRSTYKETRQRLANPKNAVADSGIDLKRPKMFLVKPHNPQPVVDNPKPAKPEKSPEIIDLPHLDQMRLAVRKAMVENTFIPSMSQIVWTVCPVFHVEPVQIHSAVRTYQVVLARHVCMYLAHHMTLQSISAIGKYLGKRDHTTALHGIRRITRLIEQDQDLAEKVNNLRAMLS